MQTPKEATATLQRIQTSDQNKNDWAETNGIRMLRIRYDEDVTKALDQKLLPRIAGSGAN